MDKQQQEFWSKAALTADTYKCWVWQLGVTDGGYGSSQVKIDGVMWYKAHRLAFYYFFNVNPNDLMVLHKCDNPPCVNPYHLFLGTNDDNMADMVIKGRSRWIKKIKTAPETRIQIDGKPKQSTKSKLTLAQVREIKNRLVAGESQTQLAKEYNVGYTAIFNINHGICWKWLEDSQTT